MREPKWIQNLKWNATEFGEVLGAKFGSPPVNLEPTEEEVIEYFNSYLQEAKDLADWLAALKHRLKLISEHLRSHHPGSPRRTVIEEGIAFSQRSLEDFVAYRYSMEERLQLLLALNGYEDKPWCHLLVIGEHPPFDLGAVEVNDNPSEEQVSDYFLTYVEDARDLLESTLSRRSLLSGMVDDESEQTELGLETDPNPLLRCAREIAESEALYFRRLEEKIVTLLSVKGYQSRPWILPIES